MAEENIVYELLINKETAMRVIDTIKLDNFWIKKFLTDSVIVNGDASEYYSSNPAKGVGYKKKGMKWDDDIIFKCLVPVLVKKIYQCRITEDMLRIATGSPEKAEMIAALQADNLRKQLDMDISEECVKVVCKKENFATDSIKELAKDADIETVIRAVFDLAENMKHSTNKYNKGYKDKNNNYKPILAGSGKLKNLVIVVNTALKTDLRLEGSKTFNYNLVNLKEEFDDVYDTNLPTVSGDTGYRWEALVMDLESFAMNWNISPRLIVQDHPEDPLSKKVSYPGFVVGGPISFMNMGAIVRKNK